MAQPFKSRVETSEGIEVKDPYKRYRELDLYYNNTVDWVNKELERSLSVIFYTHHNIQLVGDTLNHQKFKPVGI